MTLEQIIKEINDQDLEVHIYRYPGEVWKDDHWRVDIEKQNETTKLEVRRRGPELLPVLESAFEQFRNSQQGYIDFSPALPPPNPAEDF